MMVHLGGKRLNEEGRPARNREAALARFWLVRAHRQRGVSPVASSERDTSVEAELAPG